jgi:beta-glucanase (GH16 family)
LYRVRSAARTLLACAVTAGLVAGCGSLPDTNKAPDIQSLPSPAPTAPLPSPSAASVTPTPTPTAKPKPAGAQPGRGTARSGSATGLGAGRGFKPVGGDEFNAPTLDQKRWGLYDSVGGFGNGLRRPSAITQSAGNLVITATGKTSGGMGDSFGQTYGRWEFRARTDHGRGFGSAILLWPDSEKKADGEIDIAEVPAEQRDQAHFVLHSGPDGDPLDGTHMVGDFSQWHTFAVDWLPDHITWYVDGRARFTVTNRAHIPTTPMHLAIQLDQGPVKDWMPAPDATTPEQVRLQVDWVRVYSWAGAPAATKTTAPPSTQPERG